MENFKHKNKEVRFWSTTGEILGQNKYSETHVSSSGGGGYVGKHGGHVSAPKVHSTTVTNHEFWIKQEDGNEKAVQLSGHDIPLREGQKITLISAGIKGKDSGYYSVLINHNANKHWFINKAEGLNTKLKIYQTSGKSILIAGGLWWGVAQASKQQIIDVSEYSLASLWEGLILLFPKEVASDIINPIWDLLSNPNPILVGACVAGGFVILRGMIKIPRIFRMLKKLNLHLESLAQASYKNT